MATKRNEKPMSVQAKFRCNMWQKIQNHPTGDPEFKVSFTAAVGPENEPWSKYTPSAALTMIITNPGAGEWFLAGEDYLLTFDRVEKPQ